VFKEIEDFRGIKGLEKFQLEDARKFRSAFQNLFNIYIHELSEYNNWLDTQINYEGNYLTNEVLEYFSSELKHPYVVIRDNHPIGFVVFSYPDVNESDGCDCYIEELFITKPNRKNGIAAEIANEYWKTEKGVCGLCILKKNTNAITFWENTIKANDYTYTLENQGELWFYKVSLQGEKKHYEV